MGSILRNIGVRYTLTTYSSAVSIPSEIVAAAVLMQFWVDTNSGVWITVFSVLVIATLLVFVRVFGELEFVCCSPMLALDCADSSPLGFLSAQDLPRDLHQPSRPCDHDRWRSEWPIDRLSILARSRPLQSVSRHSWIDRPIPRLLELSQLRYICLRRGAVSHWSVQGRRRLGLSQALSGLAFHRAVV